MNKWIPVKEKLPGKKGEYLCTSRWSNTWDYEVKILEYGKPTGIWKGSKKVFDNGRAFGERWADGIDNLEEVIAWMQLPDVYEIRGAEVDDSVSRQDVIDRLLDWADHSITQQEEWHLRQVICDIKTAIPTESKKGEK